MMIHWWSSVDATSTLPLCRQTATHIDSWTARANIDTDCDENAEPLLVGATKTMPSPFPWLPMLAISISLVSHSYALTSLFPYVGYMVQHLGITDDKDEAGELCPCAYY